MVPIGGERLRARRPSSNLARLSAAIHRFLVTAPSGLTSPLARELEALGAGSVSIDHSGCRVRGPLSFAYRICMHARLASRVLMPLVEVVAKDADELASKVGAFPWEEHLDVDGTLAVDFTGRGMGIDHTKFGAQRVKDGITDRFRAQFERRPSVDTVAPDLRIHAHARGKACQLSLDLSGGGLHRRGYRTEAGIAPIRETLAASMLVDADWPAVAGDDGAVMVDPMCGAGTLVIEAALIACCRAPGLTRERFGFERWKGHDAEAWSAIVDEAQGQVETPRRVVAVGFDEDPEAIELARANAERAGVSTSVRFSVSRCADVKRPGKARSGVVVTNPPYGERLGGKPAAREAYTELGELLRAQFVGWRASIIATDDALFAATGLAPDRSRAVMQGPLEARVVGALVGPVEGDLVNRLRKNHKRLAKWTRREGIEVYRVYDADLPEYAAAVDLYRDRAVVQEYAPPAEIPLDKAATRRLEIVAAVAHVFEIPAHHVYVKTRRRQKGADQYRRSETDPAISIVAEAGHEFRVDLASYLDTGLFPDHRRTRALLGELAKDKDVLNLFAYTGTATVYAAKGGARSTTTVDLSKTYLDWAKRNLELNDIRGDRHRLVRADVLAWLEQETRAYDVVFCDPPTFSNSKSMDGTWDVQRDHAELLAKVAARVRPGGVILFSTNARRFKLADPLPGLQAEEITKQTTSPDFERRPLHRAWRLVKDAEPAS
jgi:23S rRNA (guanine2445-N2)-methyltransferase / 23S rRNA (guanine2069-N7)-methyltransferase